MKKLMILSLFALTTIACKNDKKTEIATETATENPVILNGDKLIGTYTFDSEGKSSSREVAYELKDNQLIEGYGDLDDSGTKFKDVNTIKYTSTTPLLKVDCAK